MKIGITLGDPAGVGPETVLRAVQETERRNLLLIGSEEVLKREAKRLKVNYDGVGVIDTGPVGKYEYGRVQKGCGVAAWRALERGVELLRSGTIGALVTAPVSKEALRLAGFPFPGQTEFLAQRLRARRYAMLAWSRRFKVIFVTIHVPLGHVAPLITARAVQEKILLIDEFLRREAPKRFRHGTQPKIAVLAFNPHGREFSAGEEKRIEAGVKSAQKKKVAAFGPIPADAIFAHLDEFDGFVAMYHDQAMIPAKLLSQGRGVNVTLGLEAVRTSPLHGVAFDIAGQGIASHHSTLAAIQLARKLAR
jgi:4-hydroxythreonine-4-phosphate dehydrogenase